ncbi:MAG: Gfo/Idh/MocA family protein [Planctomycetota bacterium]
MENSLHSTRHVLVVGGGSIGERHVRCFQQTGRAVVSLCEVRDDVRKRVAESYGLSRSFADFEAAVGESFDAAVICTPAHLHLPMAKQLAEQGTALLIEKPLSTSPDGIAELQQQIEARQLEAAVAYVMRVHPALQAMKQTLASERFGRPLQLVYVGGQHFPFYRPAYRETYYVQRETGGGAIQDALTHMLNAAEWLIGPVTKLVADAEHCLLDGSETEDTVHLLTRHERVLGSFSLNQHQAPNETTMTVVCERGTVRFEGHSARWLSCSEPGTEWTIEKTFQIERDDLFVRQANAFLDQLDGVAPPACSLAEGAGTLRVNLAALESVDTGKWVEV